MAEKTNDDVEIVARLESELSKKEISFVLELEKDRNATLAAIRAGYTAGKNNRSAATQAARLLKKDEILEYMHARARLAYRALGFSPESVMLITVEILNRCMQKIPVMEWDSAEKEWVESGEWKFDAKGSIEALKLIREDMGIVDETKNKFELELKVVDS